MVEWFLKKACLNESCNLNNYLLFKREKNQDLDEKIHINLPFSTINVAIFFPSNFVNNYYKETLVFLSLFYALLSLPH